MFAISFPEFPSPYIEDGLISLFSICLIIASFISLKIQLPIHKEIPKLLGMIGNLFIRTLALNTALYFATSYATDYGASYIAAYTIGVNIWLLGAFMIDGYASAGNILAGRLLGAKDFKTLYKLSGVLTKYGFLTGGILMTLGFIGYNFIGEIFTQEPDVLQQFNSVFYIVLITQPLNAVTFIFDGMFKGMGKMKYLRNVLLLSTGFVFLPTLLLFDYFDFKLTAIWIAFTLWIVARGLPLVVAFRKEFLPLART